MSGLSRSLAPHKRNPGMESRREWWGYCNAVYCWRSAAVTVAFTCGTWPATETVPDLPNAFTVVPSRK
jgi:hypothetical protein